MSITEGSPEQRTVLSDEEANSFIRGHVQGTVQWYWRESRKWEFRALGLQVTTLSLSALVTIVAAAPHSTEYGERLKWLVVVLSAFTTLSSALLSRTGVERTAQLRELGRVRVVAAEEKTLLLLTRKPMTLDERLAVVEKLYDAITEVEMEFGINPLVARRRPESTITSKLEKSKERRRPISTKNQRGTVGSADEPDRS